MTNLWRSAAVAAILTGLAGTLAGCASPHYPIDRDQAAGPAPLAAPKPEYPISRSDASPPAGGQSVQSSEATAPAKDDTPPAASDGLAAPSHAVESQALPPAAGARSASDAGAPAAADAPADGATPSSTASTPASPPPSPPPPPAATGPAASADEPALTPKMVIHDQPTTTGTTSSTVSSTPVVSHPATRTPTVREATADTAPARHATDPHEAITGDVVDAKDEIFENYEVQKGDHIDALARAFDTTRKVLVDANDVKPPYVLRPGQIVKVPVAKAYVAGSGDTLSGVARRFSVEVGELAQLNHLSERAALHDGQRIGLPSSMRDKGPLRIGGSSEYASSASRGERPTYTLSAPAHPGLTPLNSGNGGGSITQEHSGYATQTSPPPPPAAQSTPALSDADISAAAHGRFVWPVRGDILARFGPLGVGRRNDGVDIRAAQGSVVKAAAPGEVVYAGDQVPGYGNLVLIKHADGWVTAYAHLDTVNVQMKDQVSQGQAVGSVGTTGGVTEPELHFEVRYAPTPADKARPVDPVLVLPAS